MNQLLQLYFLLDFSQFDGLNQLGRPPLHEIAENMKGIQKDINSISTGWHKMKVITYTTKEVEEEMKKILEIRNQSKAENQSS